MQQHRWLVGSETVRMLELGHPWVVSDAYTKKWPSGKLGQTIELCDGRGRFVATALLDPGERIAARVLDCKPINLDRAWFLKRFQAAIELRRNHADLLESDAYRLVNAEGDGIPGLTVDCYADYLMIQLYSAVWRPHIQIITQILQELLSPLGIYEKQRPRNTRDMVLCGDTKNCGRLLVGSPAAPRIEVRENGLTFLVSLEQGLNTGLFLDQRKNRFDLMKRVEGKRVLNLFAYTGAFSVAAAIGGASLVSGVDASLGYSEWAKSNFNVNRINPKQHEFITGDCLAVLGELKKEKKHYDVILMDPPSFSTTARSRFTTRGGTSDLVAAALPLLSDGGLFIASSNHQKVDLSDYLKELRRGALQSQSDLRVISLLGQPEDFPYAVTFPEGRYLKYAVCVKERS